MPISNSDWLRNVTLLHGPRDLLTQYFCLADSHARDAGLHLTIRADFSGLIELNRARHDMWPPIPPIFDPGQSAINPASAFWLEGRDEKGETIVAHAVRLFDLRGSLDDELRSLGAFYADPTCHLANGERFEVSGTSASAISGRVVHGGAFWVHADYRRQGLASFVPRITRACAFARWNPGFIWGFVEQRLHAGGLTQAYGPYQSTDVVVSGIEWRRGVTFHLVWMTAQAMLADIERIVDQESNDRSRRSEIPRTNRSPPLPRHGVRNLS